jgi:hypothetical protein
VKKRTSNGKNFVKKNFFFFEKWKLVLEKKIDFNFLNKI